MSESPRPDVPPRPLSLWLYALPLSVVAVLADAALTLRLSPYSLANVFGLVAVAFVWAVGMTALDWHRWRTAQAAEAEVAR